jgi:hypothetical protein
MNNLHMKYLKEVTQSDIAVLEHKERTYGGSWKKRGGVGAFMMLARKWDRLEGILNSRYRYDLFDCITCNPDGADGTALAEMRDLRRYLLLVESEMVARGAISVEAAPNQFTIPFGTPEDGGHHDKENTP